MKLFTGVLKREDEKGSAGGGVGGGWLGLIGGYRGLQSVAWGWDLSGDWNEGYGV
jgi:hypothetical protein